MRKYSEPDGSYDPMMARRFARLFQIYRITREEYLALVEKQGDRCAICLTTSKGSWKGKPNDLWGVDHSHLTGKVRGLLCFKCNTAIGLLGENPGRMRKAASYVMEKL